MNIICLLIWRDSSSCFTLLWIERACSSRADLEYTEQLEQTESQDVSEGGMFVQDLHLNCLLDALDMAKAIIQGRCITAADC